tara:strand:- start:688 stop:840 length:153 start_codon:yes stop_codon:yes gene_type:complete
MSKSINKEMLMALEMCVREICESVNYEERYPDTVKVVDVAEEIIAKAKGN